jgi:hypothetical protein
MDTQTGEPGGLADALRPLMDAQSELIGVYGQLLTVQMPLAHSPGMAEIAGEAAFCNADWSNPVQQAHSFGGLLTFATLDHFAAYTRLLSTNPVPYFSSQATARAGIDAASLAYWLNEPAIGTRARVQRGQAMLLGAARQMERAPDYVSDAHATADRIAASVKAGAVAHGWSISGKREQPRVGAEALPKPTSAFDTVLDDPSFPDDPNPPVAEGVWWWLSGYTHSGVHVLVQQIEETSAPDASALGIRQGQIAVTAEHTAAIAATLARGVRKAMNAYRRLVGAEIAEWDARHRRWSRTVLDLFDQLERLKAQPPSDP